MVLETLAVKEDLMKCELCKETIRANEDTIAVFKTDSMHVCKDCANALFVNRKLLNVSLVEQMPRR